MSKPENVKCPECGGPMTPRTSQYGTFWGCVRYPKCRGTRDVQGMSKGDRDEAKGDNEPGDEYRWDR